MNHLDIFLRKFIYDVVKAESSVSNLRISCTGRSGIARSRLTIDLAAGQTLL